MTDGSAVGTTRHATRRLAIDLLLAYLSAWIIGTAFGYAIRKAGIWDAGTPWERALLRWFHAQSLPAWLDAVVLQVPLTGTNLTILPAIIVIGWWLWKRARRPIDALHLFVVSIGSLSLNPTMKYMLDRDRPDLFPRRGMYNWASYPSGHSILTIALYVTVALMLHRERGWRWPFAVAALVFLANAYSRLYLAVHWPTDIVGGLLIGVVWLIGTWRAFALYRQRVARNERLATAPLKLAAAQR
ncbi:MAG TPA: phosphatase PAP2 family protein [Gemmatimonadaceae bacterium]|nr:phosphatase PAP2 family protein [Gemmatimonadaceae bacterium]